MSFPAAGVVIDRYQVQEPVGAGSMGDVVKAVDIDLKRTVAIKILSEKHRNDPELEARFIREGRAVAAISHANVVQVFTTGTYDGRPYIAMELLSGCDLGGFVQQRGPLTSLHAAQAILETARGLQAAANAGLIHRDVKPANLVMLDTGLVKVTDFGLARPLDPTSEPALTALGVVVGTPDYIAPEQARGQDIDERVDIYALGGTLYYLLIGMPPFRTGNAAEDKYLKVVARHLQDPAPNPMVVSPEVDAQLARLQLRMMSKKPEGRPRYPELISELLEIIDRLGGRRSSTAPESMEVTGTSDAPAPTPYLGGRTQDHPQQNVPVYTPAPPLHTPAPPLHTPAPPLHTPAPPLHTPAPVEDSIAFEVPPQSRSKVLVVTTTLSALLFLAGLLLFLFGPLPKAESQVATTPMPLDDAGVGKASTDATSAMPAPKELTAPNGMQTVPSSEAHPAFFISSTPVSYKQFSEIFPNVKKSTRNRKAQAAAVNNVTFAYAQAYARTKGGRLASPLEWNTAIKKLSPTSIWEWLDDETQGTQAPRAVGNTKGAIAKRRPRQHKDVGFRIVIDP